MTLWLEESQIFIIRLTSALKAKNDWKDVIPEMERLTRARRRGT